MPLIRTGTWKTPRRGLDQPAFDRWTFAHMLVGVAYGALGLSLGTAAVLGVGFELLERPLKRTEAWRVFQAQPAQDSIVNAAADVGSVVAGWGLGAAVRDRRQSG